MKAIIVAVVLFMATAGSAMANGVAVGNAVDSFFNGMERGNRMHQQNLDAERSKIAIERERIQLQRERQQMERENNQSRDKAVRNSNEDFKICSRMANAFIANGYKIDRMDAIARCIGCLEDGTLTYEEIEKGIN